MHQLRRKFKPRPVGNSLSTVPNIENMVRQFLYSELNYLVNHSTSRALVQASSSGGGGTVEQLEQQQQQADHKTSPPDFVVAEMPTEVALPPQPDIYMDVSMEIEVNEHGQLIEADEGNMWIHQEQEEPTNMNTTCVQFVETDMADNGMWLTFAWPPQSNVTVETIYLNNGNF